jgi:uncharacterized membrane protein YqjE
MTQTQGNGRVAGTGQDRPIGELVTDLSAQVSRLVHDELRLARLELAAKGKRAGMGAGMFGGSGLVALYAVAALLAGAILGLAIVLPAWAAALVVGGALLVVAAGLALLGRRQLKRATPPLPEQTVGSVKADVEAIREGASR